MTTLAPSKSEQAYELLHERIAKGKTSDPADASQPAPMIEMPAWEKVLTPEEIDAVIDYVYSLRPAGGDDWSE